MQYQGPRRAKPPFPINLIFNQKLFYVAFIVTMIASMAAVGLGTGNAGSRRSRLDPEATPPPEATPSAALNFDRAERTINTDQPYVATIVTNQGQIKVELTTGAPETVNSFAFLAGNGFYNGTLFFFKDENFVQAGDPTCKLDSETLCSGLGGPGYSLPLESSDDTHEQWSLVAPVIAPGGAEVHGSQFRILYKADSRLDGEETVFGRVVEGQDILEGLADLVPCSFSSDPGCSADLSSALVIQEVVVQKA